MKRYRTVYGEGEAEYVTERSRFIACARPAASREEAEAFFASRRAAHRAATHHVPAFVVGEKRELQWMSDDGEPQGTAGAPILRLLTAEDITDVALIVTRYFGGIKLGTGGLVRAYTAAAQAALSAARPCDVCERVLSEYETEYSFHGKIENAARNGGFDIEDTVFAERVVLRVSSSPEEEARTEETMANLTAGTAKRLSRRLERVRRLPPSASAPARDAD